MLRRQWPAIVLCALLGLLLSALYVSTSKVTYESKSTVLLLALPGEVAPGGGLQRTLDVETQSTIARSTALLQTVGDRLGMTASEVKGSSRVEASPTGDVMFIYFVDANAERAAEGALTYTEEFLAQRKATADNEAKREKAVLQQQIDDLDEEIVNLTNQINDQIRSRRRRRHHPTRGAADTAEPRHPRRRRQRTPRRLRSTTTSRPVRSWSIRALR